MRKMRFSWQTLALLPHFFCKSRIFRAGREYKTIAKKVGTLILTGPTSEKIENATKIALIDSPNKSLDIVHCTNLEEAVKIAKQKSNSGDIVLLSPASASFDAFKNFEERGKKFKQLVNEL